MVTSAGETREFVRSNCRIVSRRLLEKCVKGDESACQEAKMFLDNASSKIDFFIRDNL